MKNLSKKLPFYGAALVIIIGMSAFSVNKEKVNVCHLNHHTMLIDKDDLNVHLKHGDTQGLCYRYPSTFELVQDEVFSFITKTLKLDKNKRTK